MSRRQSESGSDGESSRGEQLVKRWVNNGQKRKQADALSRRPVGVTRGQRALEAIGQLLRAMTSPTLNGYNKLQHLRKTRSFDVSDVDIFSMV